MNNNILIIAYYYPPSTAIGAQRASAFMRHLPNYGWNPIVLTKNWNENYPTDDVNQLPVIKIPNWSFGNILHTNNHKIAVKKLQMVQPVNTPQAFLITTLKSISRSLLYIPDPQISWYIPALKKAEYLMKIYHFNTLITTSSPETSHLIGWALKKKFPAMIWIADFRDLWTQNHYYNYYRWRKIIDTKIEKIVIKKADALVTVSDPLAAKLRRRYKDSTVFTITNGFEPSDHITNKANSDKTCKFRILYTGRLYSGKRDPSMLFSTIKALLDRGEIDKGIIEIDFYGPDLLFLESLATKYSIRDIVNMKKVIPRQDILEEQKNATILLLLNWNEPNETGVYTGKIFEYLGARRPIIAIGGPKGVVSELLEMTKTGKHFSDNEKDSLSEYLIDSYKHWKTTGALHYDADDIIVNKYSWENIVKQYATIIESYTHLH